MSEAMSLSVTEGYRWRWLTLAVLLLAEAMNLLDVTIVRVAAPAMHAELGGSVSDIQWFSSAYTLSFALLLITGGRLGDIAGRRRVFQIGVLGFMVASLACALAPSVGMLIGFRTVQGAAAAMIIPQTIGLIRAMFDGDELPRALGYIGPVIGLAAVCGPILGAVLTHADLFGLSWRPVFLVNIPLSAAVLLVVPKLIEDRAPKRPGLDPAGTALVILGTGLIVYPLTGADLAQLSARNWLPIGIGIGVVVGFALHQRRGARLGRSPLIEASLFAHHRFPAALVTCALFFAVSSGLMLVVILQLELGLGSGVLTAGFTLVPWSAGMAVSSWVAGRRTPGRRVMFVGLAVLVAGVLAATATYHYASMTTYPTPLPAALGVIGLGAGMFTRSFFAVALRPVSPQQIGSASGLLSAVQQLGTTLGIAVIGGVYLGGAQADVLGAAQRALWVAAALLATTALAGALMAEPSPAPS